MRHVASLFVPEFHFNLEPIKVQRIKIIQLSCCSTNWKPQQTSKKSPNVFNIAVDWWPILQGRQECTRHDNFQGRLHLNIYFFSMFSLTLETKVTRIHCTSSGRLNTVLEYIKWIKRTCKVGDFKIETSEEQRLDWLDNSVWCWVLGAKMCRSFCWSSTAVIELKRKGLIFLSSNTASNSNNKLDYFSNCSFWNGVWRNRVVWVQICFQEAAFYMLSISFQQIDNRFRRDKILKIQLSCELYGFDLQ